MMRKSFMFLSVILLISFVSASFSIGNSSHDVENKYGAGGELIGWINLSFQDEPSDSLITTNLNSRSVKIIDLLKLNDNNYDCETVDCNTSYSPSMPETNKLFSLNAGESRLYGLKFNGESVRNIEELNFTVTSDSGASCSTPLKIDIGDDGEIDYISSKVSNELCASKNYGCYNNNAGVYDYYNLRSAPYCQKINISETPGVTVGAHVKKGTGGAVVLKMKILDSEESVFGECTLPELTEDESEISCDMEFSVVEPEEYYVCIFADQSTTYQIRGESNPVNLCGYSGYTIPSSFESAYSIFVQQKKFAPVGSFSISDDSFSTLSDSINLFLDEKYNSDGFGFNCSKGCSFPITFISQSPQQISLSDLKVNYERKGGQITENNFYEIVKSTPKISSGYEQIYLDKANLNVPGTVGNYTLVLKLREETIFSQNIETEDTIEIDFLYPLRTAVNFDTSFLVGLNKKNRTIVKYEWDFGDGNKLVSQSPRVTHLYNTTKNYTLNINVIDDKSFSISKKFIIEVVSAKERLNLTLESEKKKLDVLNDQISNNVPVLFKDDMRNALNLDTVADDLKRIEKGFLTASTESAYSNFLKELISINLPESINVTEKANNVIYFPQEEVVDLSLISDLGVGNVEDYDNEDVLRWSSENVEMKLNYLEYSGMHSGSSQGIIKTFVLDIHSKGSYNYETFLIFDSMDNLNVKGDWDLKEKDNVKYIRFEDSEDKTVAFSTTSDVDFTNTRVYLTPELSKLDSTVGGSLICNQDKKCDSSENWKNCSDCKPTGLIIMIIVLLIIVGVTVYIILHKWYKNHYERALFKNHNDLYNLINYIHHSRARGVKDDHIKSSLKKSSWSGEQVDYALKKYSGKRTGLWHPFENQMK